MSKQFEAEIGVETSLTVCYSKNDFPIKMRRRKVRFSFSESRSNSPGLSAAEAFRAVNAERTRSPRRGVLLVGTECESQKV